MNMKLERIKRNWSQTDLSEKADVCRSLISQIENGRLDNIQLGTLKKLAAALDSTVEELFLSE